MNEFVWNQIDKLWNPVNLSHVNDWLISVKISRFSINYSNFQLKCSYKYLNWTNNIINITTLQNFSLDIHPTGWDSFLGESGPRNPNLALELRYQIVFLRSGQYFNFCEISRRMADFFLPKYAPKSFWIADEMHEYKNSCPDIFILSTNRADLRWMYLRKTSIFSHFFLIYESIIQNYELYPSFKHFMCSVATVPGRVFGIFYFKGVSNGPGKK